MEEKRSFILYSSYMEQFNELSDEQAGKLIKAIFMYAEKKIIPEFDDGMVKMAFSFIKSRIDLDLEKWNKTREKCSEAGRKGGKQTQANQANDSLVKQTQANQAVNVNDNVNVNVNDNVINIPPISPKGDKPKKKPETDSFSKSFDDFWKAYPKKVSKSNALKAWKKLKPNDDLVREILSALEKQKQSSQWQKDNGQFIPYPTTWLNGKRWEDDLNTGEEESHEHNSRLYEGLL